MVANNNNGNITVLLLDLEICIIPLFQLNSFMALFFGSGASFIHIDKYISYIYTEKL